LWRMRGGGGRQVKEKRLDRLKYPLGRDEGNRTHRPRFSRRFVTGGLPGPHHTPQAWFDFEHNYFSAADAASEAGNLPPPRPEPDPYGADGDPGLLLWMEFLNRIEKGFLNLHPVLRTLSYSRRLTVSDGRTLDAKESEDALKRRRLRSRSNYLVDTDWLVENPWDVENVFERLSLEQCQSQLEFDLSEKYPTQATPVDPPTQEDLQRWEAFRSGKLSGFEALMRGLSMWPSDDKCMQAAAGEEPDPKRSDRREARPKDERHRSTSPMDSSLLPPERDRDVLLKSVEDEILKLQSLYRRVDAAGEYECLDVIDRRLSRASRRRERVLKDTRVQLPYSFDEEDLLDEEKEDPVDRDIFNWCLHVFAEEGGDAEVVHEEGGGGGAGGEEEETARQQLASSALPPLATLTRLSGGPRAMERMEFMLRKAVRFAFGDHRGRLNETIARGLNTTIHAMRLLKKRAAETPSLFADVRAVNSTSSYLSDTRAIERLEIAWHQCLCDVVSEQKRAEDLENPLDILSGAPFGSCDSRGFQDPWRRPKHTLPKGLRDVYFDDSEPSNSEEQRLEKRAKRKALFGGIPPRVLAQLLLHYTPAWQKNQTFAAEWFNTYFRGLLHDKSDYKGLDDTTTDAEPGEEAAARRYNLSDCPASCGPNIRRAIIRIHRMQKRGFEKDLDEFTTKLRVSTPFLPPGTTNADMQALKCLRGDARDPKRPDLTTMTLDEAREWRERDKGALDFYRRKILRPGRKFDLLDGTMQITPREDCPPFEVYRVEKMKVPYPNGVPENASRNLHPDDPNLVEVEVKTKIVPDKFYDDPQKHMVLVPPQFADLDWVPELDPNGNIINADYPLPDPFEGSEIGKYPEPAEDPLSSWRRARGEEEEKETADIYEEFGVKSSPIDWQEVRAMRQLSGMQDYRVHLDLSNIPRINREGAWLEKKARQHLKSFKGRQPSKRQILKFFEELDTSRPHLRGEDGEWVTSATLSDEDEAPIKAVMEEPVVDKDGPENDRDLAEERPAESHKEDAEEKAMDLQVEDPSQVMEMEDVCEEFAVDHEECNAESCDAQDNCEEGMEEEEESFDGL